MDKQKVEKYLERVEKENPISAFEQRKAFAWIEKQVAIDEGKIPESLNFNFERFWSDFNSEFPKVLDKEHLYFIASYFELELKRIRSETQLGVLSVDAIKKQGA